MATHGNQYQPDFPSSSSKILDAATTISSLPLYMKTSWPNTKLMLEQHFLNKELAGKSYLQLSWIAYRFWCYKTQNSYLSFPRIKCSQSPGIHFQVFFSKRIYVHALHGSDNEESGIHSTKNNWVWLLFYLYNLMKPSELQLISLKYFLSILKNVNWKCNFR